MLLISLISNIDRNKKGLDEMKAGGMAWSILSVIIELVWPTDSIANEPGQH